MKNLQVTRMAADLKSLYCEALSQTGDSMDDAVERFSKLNDRLVMDECEVMAQFLTDNLGEKFAQSEFYARPDYYAPFPEYRSTRIVDMDGDLPSEIVNFYNEDLEMTEYFMDRARKNMIRNIGDWAEDVDILVDTNDLEDDDLAWGNTDIMSEEDWDKCNEAYDENMGDYFPEQQGYEDRAMVNIFEWIDGRLDWWNGYDGILTAVQAMLDSDKPLEAMIWIENIERVMTNSKLSWSRRIDRAKAMVDKFEQIDY